jgi:hypothetical protein
MLAIGLGYGCFLYSSITVFRRYFREHAEIELAAEPFCGAQGIIARPS